MTQVTHRQFDEAPSRFFTLTFPGVAPGEWPPLNVDDKVTMLLQQGSTDRAVALTITDPAAREVRWDPTGPAVATAGEAKFVIRVTEANGRSYTHPEVGLWTLKVERTAPATDLADPA